MELTLALKEKGKIKLTLRCNVLKKGRFKARLEMSSLVHLGLAPQSTRISPAVRADPSVPFFQREPEASAQPQEKPAQACTYMVSLSLASCTPDPDCIRFFSYGDLWQQ